VALLACGGGGRRTPDCIAELTFTSGKYSTEAPFKGHGSGKTADEAIENSCWDYCYGADEDFDARYTAWLDTKATKSHKDAYATDRFKGKTMAIMDAELRRDLDRCISRCLMNVKGKTGGFAATAQCGKLP
jgi:hypothetical protein